MLPEKGEFVQDLKEETELAKDTVIIKKSVPKRGKC
jgi:hypothetical protein